MIFHTRDYDALNKVVLQNLPFAQRLRVMNLIKANSREIEDSPLFPVPRIPEIDDPIAKRHALTDAAKIKLGELNHIAWFRREAKSKEEKVAKFRSFPREPGTHTPPPVKRDPKEVAHAKRVAKEVAHVHALEEALVTAKARLERLR